MPLQRTLLRAMLWALAATAGVGVLIIFLPGRELTTRLFATGAITAIAIALAMPASRLLDSPGARASALTALGTIVLTYATALLAVWSYLLRPRFEEYLGLTTPALGACGLAAAGLVGALRFPLTKVAGTVGLACTGAVFVFFMLGIWHDLLHLPWDAGRLAGTGGSLAGFSALACLCLLGAGVDRHHWRLLGLAAAAVGFALSIPQIWQTNPGTQALLLQCIIAAAAVAHANIFFRVPLPAGQRWFALGVIGSMLATGVCLSSINAITNGEWWKLDNELLARVCAALAIVTGCGTLALIVLNRFNRRRGPLDLVAGVAGISRVAIACPHCGKRQHSPLGGCACPGCNLIITITVTEPRCAACGYATLDLKGDKCPECGGPVATPLPGAVQA